MAPAQSGHTVLKGFRNTPELGASQLGRGIGVSGGALSGRAVFNMTQIEQMRSEAPDEALILVRYDTVPDDIKEISKADGLLTARGGQTSHAAVVAARLGKTCVVGCEDLAVWEQEGYCCIGEHEIRFRDDISIDGHQGTVLEGRHPLASGFFENGSG